ncbi:MAG: hypothetical protein ACRDHY_18475 [Anaerolineales bacterium]
MPIAAADLIPYLSANHPDDDTSTAGGGIDTAGRPVFTQWTANAVAAVVSDGADTRTVTVEGRSAAGAIVSEVLTLTGATEVVGATTFERVLKITLSATDASRTVTVKQGSGGATRATIGPNETKRFAMFKRSASESAITIRFDKFFWKNTHASLTLNSAAGKLTADPDARIRMGLAASKGDTATITNRKTTPSGITFVDDNVSQTVPTGTLAAGETIGVWIEQNLPASDAAHKTTFTHELSGTTV